VTYFVVLVTIFSVLHQSILIKTVLLVNFTYQTNKYSWLGAKCSECNNNKILL